MAFKTAVHIEKPCAFFQGLELFFYKDLIGVEFSHQCHIAGGIGGLDGGDIDDKGVVDAEVFEELDLQVVADAVAAINFADFA